MMFQTWFYILLVGISLVYALFLRVMAFRNDLKYIALFLFLYCQGLLVYYVWNPSPNHFYTIVSPMVLLAVLILKLSLEETGLKRYRRPVLLILSTCVFLAFYLPSLHAYYTEKDTFDEIFRNHKIYAWSFPRARIRTTMGPQYVSEAVDMIKKYSPGQKAVYMVSKYDNLFPFLAERYSAMPFYEVATSLLTRKEVDECIKAIRADQPRFLFVDTEIVEQPGARPDYWSRPVYRFAAEQFDLRPRIQMLETLARVYAGVRDMYKVSEKGSLISVCEFRY
jgi:hypothetical protein